MTMIRKFHKLRRLTGAFLLALLIGIPFLRIGGESAFRFDVPSLRLLFFGTEIWMADFFIILIAVIFLTFFTLFTTTVLGRVWCGWLCPQTVLVDVTTFVETAGKRGYAAMIAAATAGMVMSAVIAISLIGYFVSPYDILSLLRTGGAPAQIVGGSALVLTLLLFLDLVALRRRFCATACPYAKLQSVLFDDRTLVVAFDPGRAKECMECGACVKACPVGIDIRKGQEMACIQCAECVDACTERMAFRKKPSLVRYVFGLAGKRGTGTRVNPLITGIITAASLLFFVYLSASKIPFDMNVRLNYDVAPRIQADGSVANIYELSLRNMGKADMELDLHASTPSGEVRVSPDAIMLRRSADITRLPVTVALHNVSANGHGPIPVTLTLQSKQSGKSITKTVHFVIPKKK
jgi:cytochrome c oxidase accessory protein FixG